uniref:Uncharacterized protein n=1 Tax=viral metagenome TaxID=1070528 RepID=A0A6C0K536_9ZZZZ
MSFIYFYINLLDAGLAAPNLGLPCVPNTENAVNVFIITPSSPSTV